MTDETNIATVNDETEVVANEAGNASADIVSTVDAGTQEQPESKPTSLREALAANFDKLAEQQRPGEQAIKAPALSNVTPVATEGKQEVDPFSGKPLEAIKAPAGWTPALREQWPTLPRNVQKFITDRERDMAQNYSKLGADAKFAREVKDQLTPFEGYFKQYQIDPTDRIKQLVQVDHALVTGNSGQRAQVIWNLIQTFQPDAVVLQALASGKPVNVPFNQPQVDIEAEVQKRIDAQRTQDGHAQAEEAIKAFGNDPNNEFFNDVRDIMSKMFNAGLITDDVPLEQQLAAAYKKACQEHPEVVATLAKRAREQQRQPVRQAKPSRGASTASSTPAKKMSLRDQISANFDAMMNK